MNKENFDRRFQCLVRLLSYTASIPTIAMSVRGSRAMSKIISKCQTKRQDENDLIATLSLTKIFIEK